MNNTWNNMGWRGEDEMYDHDDLKRAYREGKKDGWREAMEEVKQNGYGERADYGERGGYGQRDGGYGERDEYGERRGVKYTGRYSRFR